MRWDLSTNCCYLDSRIDPHLNVDLLQIFKPRLCSPDDLKAFHSEEYVDFLSKITPENQV